MPHGSGCDSAPWGLLFMKLLPTALSWCLAARSKSVIPGEGAPGPGSPRSSRSMERPLKAGWLKKQQRSLVKNWQQRYFVLRGSTLTYHKDDKETTVQVWHWGHMSSSYYNKCVLFLSAFICMPLKSHLCPYHMMTPYIFTFSDVIRKRSKPALYQNIYYLSHTWSYNLLY